VPSIERIGIYTLWREDCVHKNIKGGDTVRDREDDDSIVAWIIALCIVVIPMLAESLIG
jgi:hypothetical protein